MRNRAIDLYRARRVVRDLGLALPRPQFAVEFFAGWLTEYSLSVDNLFLFIVIMASFKVPGSTSNRRCWSGS
ncbi:terC Tellurium resistance domain protein [Mycobacterium xenopi 4042]|uniref:TerC Tellurium resistance domain protein n=1 Tax=Mycobacterium xenopi 4042 TaxID=1299334 RepID=X7ZWY8_MYCXE|nr:terC Tellurium resistance domain protein [Mycobacterium xenopi 4042]